MNKYHRRQEHEESTSRISQAMLGMRSPIRYPGGKGLKTNVLLPLMAQCSTYCEPFGGGASLLLARQPVKLEIYNDLNCGLVSLFRVLRDPIKFQQFYSKVCLTLYSRAEYYDCRDTWFIEQDELDMAYKYYVMARQWVAGRSIDKTGWLFNKPGRRDAISGWLSAIDMLPEIHKRVRSLQVDCLDFREFLLRYDNEDVLMYMDPPYFGIGRIHDHFMSESDHEDFIIMTSNLRSKVMISNYRNDLYDLLLSFGWHIHEFETYVPVAAARSSDASKCKRVETVYMNYDPREFIKK